MRVRLRISKAGEIVEEEADIKARSDSSPAVLLAAAQKFIEPRNRGFRPWEPREVLLSVVPVPPR
jgi:hypothetical protein